MKIITDSAIPFLKGRIPDSIEKEEFPGDEITSEKIKDAAAIVVRTRTKCNEGLLKDSSVKLIVTATIGTDHIDIPWCEKHGIKVKSAPGCNAPGVAQYVLASLFKSGFDIEKDTLGIIGYGNVGQKLAEWATQMGIRTLISDAPRQKAGNKDIDYKPLDFVLRNSDAVTLHVPLTKEGDFPTFHMIGKSQIGLLKQNCLLINSSRGGVVNEAELKEALKDGKIRAVTDTWENEPYIDSELLKLSFISTPHIAGYSYEGKKRATMMALEALEEYLEIKTNKADLFCNPKNTTITKKIIEDSYNPLEDSENLKNNPLDFETLRNTYNYRHEPLFS
ncbi:MAG: 4-phosphoerythronate dehydrogenase [Muribaculaceae bacterium]|nr:4-phosphoerythronate dehydrogenase [Muribaculaceae bacterium]